MRHGTVGRFTRGLLAVGLLLAVALSAQENRTRIRITKMDFRTVRTPLFRDTTNPDATSDYEWLQVYLEYETEGGRKGWADEVSIEWALLVRPPNAKPMLMQATTTYVDVEEGKHRAVMYVRPAFIRRHCESKTPNKSYFAAYVEMAADGQRLARQEYSRSNQPKNWWRAKEPDVRLMDGELLAPEDTPFACMDYDFYEHPKKKSE